MGSNVMSVTEGLEWKRGSSGDAMTGAAALAGRCTLGHMECEARQTSSYK